MNDKKIRRLVTAALCAALCCAATMSIRVPSPTGGYKNLGDCFVLVTAWILGPWWGGAAAGIGSALADLFSGYAHYVPCTFIVKGLMGVCAALLYRALEKKSAFVASLVSGLVGVTIMVAGYYGNATLIWQKWETAGVSAMGNVVQGAIGLCAAVVLWAFLRRTHMLERIRKE